jgi:hypothetical protein
MVLLGHGQTRAMFGTYLVCTLWKIFPGKTSEQLQA